MRATFRHLALSAFCFEALVLNTTFAQMHTTNPAIAPEAEMGAPAMQAATVGAAFGQNSGITAEAADAVVLETSLK